VRSDRGAPIAEHISVDSLRRGADPRIVWKTVFLHQAQPDLLRSMSSWRDRFTWVSLNPEACATAIRGAEAELTKREEVRLVLFDEIDRVAHDWTEVRALTTGLLRLILDVRSTKRLRAKAFLRSDMLG